MRRAETRDGPRRAVTQNPARGRTITTSPPPSAEVTFSVTGGADSGRCWRCGQPFTWTTPEVLARCTALAQSAEADHPLHYTDAEVTEGWPGDDPAAALEWVHRRSAREADR